MKDLFNDIHITDIDIEESMKQSYLDYSMSVIVGRAIPDARDGLKPVHRRILFAMKELNLDHNKPYKKSARVVGDVIGKYHPHGDMAVYDALARMSQEFSMRYPLIDGQGNFGSIDGDSPAAMRYTEVRFAKIAEELLKDLDKNTVDFLPNYDDSMNEPSVLPSYLPNLLMNGSSGIAVGMATNIPPHNIGEIIDGSLLYLESDGEAEIEEFFKYIKGPDFPTGGICSNVESIRQAYRTGLGKVRIRARVKQEKHKNKDVIIVYELPYQVNKSLLVQSIAELVKNKKIIGISDLRDESNKEGIRIVIELKKEEQPDVILSKLYKFTNMQVTFGINMLALVDNIPKLLNIKEAIGVFIDHRTNVVTRRTAFLLQKAKEKAHILEGLRIALDNIDEVVHIIRSSKSTQEAKQHLKDRFTLSDKQSQAILDMKLSRLVALEKQKIIDDYENIIKDIAYYESILGSKLILKNVIKEELKYVKNTYNDKRKTIIEKELDDVNIEDMIKNENLLITFSKKGYIKSIPVDTYAVQHRGGKGRIASTFADGDYIVDIFTTNSLNDLLCFTNTGRVYKLKAYMIPKLQPATKGKAIVNLLNLLNGEFIKTILPLKEGGEIFFVTQLGTVKRTSMKDFAHITANGKYAIKAVKLASSDSLIRTFPVTDNDDIIIITRNGMIIRFSVDDVRVMSRIAAGVRGIRLLEGDKVVSADRYDAGNGNRTIILTLHGRGKTISTKSIRKIKRGGKGVIGIKLSKDDYVCDSLTLGNSNDVMAVTKKGKIIRIQSQTVRTMGRAAMGVKIINIAPDDEVVSILVLKESYESGSEK